MARVIIGFTRTARALDYVPAMDGYRPGAAQDEITLEIEGVEGFTVPEVAEMIFVAVEAPYDVEGLLGEIREALRPLFAAAPFSRSVSVGDTVEVEGVGRWACARFGWDEIV